MSRLAMAAMFFAASLAAQDWPSDRFVPAEVCSDCHARLYPPGSPPPGEAAIVHHGQSAAPIDLNSVGPYALWSASMMANSARDPYWQAKVRYEARTTPAAAESIENTCLSCHAPMQQYDRRAEGRTLRFDALNNVGEQGVSCTVCHQISPENFGQADSFTAGFVINEQRRIFGPHANPFPMPMRMHTGRMPTKGDHILDAALCGTCHTVITPTLNAAGEQTGRFLEQATYLEWLNSSYPRSNKTCQSCHLAPLKDASGDPAAMFIAHTPHGGYFPPTRPRKPFGLHTFGGANVQGLELMAGLEPERAPLFKQAAERAQAMLEQSLAMRLDADRDGETLTARVRLVNSAGHKLPTGFPSRRMWLRLAVQDAAGKIVFESGAWDPITGEILARLDATEVEPHHDVIRDPAETAIYEAEMAATEGGATHSLMRAARWTKDNRLLPLGFVADRGRPDGLEDLSTAPVGVEDDPNFRAGADQVIYVAEVEPGAGPWTVTAEALFQSIKPDHAGALSGATAEEETFRKLFRSVDQPAVIGSEEAVVR